MFVIFYKFWLNTIELLQFLKWCFKKISFYLQYEKLSILFHSFFKIQIYKEELAEFRGTALPRQFSQTFSEAPDSHVIRDKLANLNSRYEKLKDRCLSHRDKLGAISEKQDKYQATVDPMLPWIEETQVALNKMLREPVAAEPAAVQNQIDQLKVWWLVMAKI